MLWCIEEKKNLGHRRGIKDVVEENAGNSRSSESKGE